MPLISVFHGVVPRMAWHRLPLESATVAHNVKLRNGRLEPWRERLAVARAVTDAVSLHAHGCCFYTYDKCVDMTEYVTDYGRLFFTGRESYPECAAVGDNCALTYYRLGVPVPSAALSVAATAETGRDAAERTYVYTYVNLFGDEGGPSSPSVPVTVKDGSPVVLTGFKVPDDVYGVTAINIYRTVTVWRTGSEKTQEPGTEFLLVTSVPVNTARYTDTVLDKSLGVAITTEDTREPPADLRHITHLSGTGILAGVTNNGVHFSAPFLPSDWPAKNDLTLPHNIVNAVSVGKVLFVSTDSYPYVIQGESNCEATQCRNVNEVNTPLPDISCGHTHSAVGTPFGMVYSSKDGLVLVSGDGKFQIITSAWFSTDDWIKIRPDTVRLACWRGYLVCITDVISFLLEIDGQTYNDETASNLSTISDAPADLMVSQSGELLMLENDIVWQWNAGPVYRAYEWTSRELGFSGEGTFTTAKLRTTGSDIELVDREGGHIFKRFVPDEKPVRLARLGRRVPWRLRITGKGTVEYAAVGTNMRLMADGGANGRAVQVR